MNGAVFFLAFFLRALILKMALLWLAALGIQQVAEHIRESEVRKGIPKHVLDSPKFKGNPREQPKFSQDLCDAAKRNDVEEIARLIQRGYASPNAMELKPPSFHRALHLAATRGHTDAMRALLANGADIDLTNDKGQTVAHVAASAKQLETLKCAPVPCPVLCEGALCKILILYRRRRTGDIVAFFSRRCE